MRTTTLVLIVSTVLTDPLMPGAKPTFEFYFNLINFVGKIKSNSSYAFHDLFYALKKQEILLKAKVQAGFESFLLKCYATPVRFARHGDGYI